MTHHDPCILAGVKPYLFAAMKACPSATLACAEQGDQCGPCALADTVKTPLVFGGMERPVSCSPRFVRQGQPRVTGPRACGALEGSAVGNMCAVAGSRAYGSAVDFEVSPWCGLLVPVAGSASGPENNPSGSSAGWRPGAVVSWLW